jgi:2-keto-4-pentenoate hydratase/2-oxohepta-3-ene-1,7-dioic acid hydratase in catechol pathway
VRLSSYRDRTDRELLAVVEDDNARAVAEFWQDGPATMAALLDRGDSAVDELRERAANADVRATGAPLSELTLLAPIPRPGKVVAVGRNYREHAAEQGVEPPGAPLLFAKWPTAVIGHRAEIRWSPELTEQVDWEAELGVVIGRRARRVGVEEALDAVLGYTCLNDVSARDLQFGDGQWTRGKSLDTFCPIGPVVVTRDELVHPEDLDIRCLVNGEEVQHARTSAMYFGVAEIVSYCSQAFSLEPGDVIATGTPSGVGTFRTPPRYLGDGDEVVVEIEGIGRLENVCRHETGAGLR